MMKLTSFLRTLATTKKSVCLYADTRAEWMVAAQASFKQSFPVVTIYTNLGEEAVVHGLSETKSGQECLPKLKKVLATRKASLKKIVYMESRYTNSSTHCCSLITDKQKTINRSHRW